MMKNDHVLQALIKFSYGVIQGHIFQYIKNEKANFGQYIMDRSNENRNNSNPQDWRYMPSILNVADDCSRGVKFNDLSNNLRWITGPSFLYRQDVKFEQDLVTGFGSNEIIDSPINVNLHHPLEDTSLSERQLSYTQIVPLDGTHFVAVRGLIHQEVPTRVCQQGELN